ncbi:LPS biosynthesis glycosyltransferase [Iningainema tapete]|uniref:LPS biosynthesis glycosyltransferase n=1 Tax=Iningainema tapete BLCC-T55 TaxID=2748662 RepID=A0A8J6XGM3_9CYAN|nr:LPS biosynthesis glycosyltransferase [Iningainema tapete]MBD2772810.1 LPS biosynthesis glycosyltransferase [Iningainema tapete BLCC-T55]
MKLDSLNTNTNQILPSDLVNSIDKVLIIAYKESTEQLEETLNREGLACVVQRQETKPEYQNFSRSYLCLLNHQRAWEKAALLSKPTLIMEADFVPVLGLGKLPLPFNPHQSDVGISWLYTCAPQVYSISPDGYAEGFSVSTVAYIVTPQGARCLLDLLKEVTEKKGATTYSSWDSTIDPFLRQRKLKNYIPWRNYGEHGGLPNPEHHQNNLSKTHRADVLYGKLAFMPMYAVNGSRQQFLMIRLQARLKGIARLVTGRFLRLRVLQGSSTPAKILRFAVFRHFSLIP